MPIVPAACLLVAKETVSVRCRHAGGKFQRHCKTMKVILWKLWTLRTWTFFPPGLRVPTSLGMTETEAIGSAIAWNLHTTRRPAQAASASYGFRTGASKSSSAMQALANQPEVAFL